MDEKTDKPVEKPIETPEPKKVEVEEKTEVKQEEEKPLEIPLENWQISPLFYEVAHFLGIEEGDYEKSAQKLSLITDWAIEKANSNKMHDILPVIRELEDKIMQPTWGETRYGNLYRYLRLAVKRDSYDKALSAFEQKKKNG